MTPTKSTISVCSYFLMAQESSIIADAQTVATSVVDKLNRSRLCSRICDQVWRSEIQGRSEYRQYAYDKQAGGTGKLDRLGVKGAGFAQIYSQCAHLCMGTKKAERVRNDDYSYILPTDASTPDARTLIESWITDNPDVPIPRS